jgi:hypothetical protein
LPRATFARDLKATGLIVALDPLAAERDEGRCMSFCTPDEPAGFCREAGLTGVTSRGRRRRRECE